MPEVSVRVSGAILARAVISIPQRDDNFSTGGPGTSEVGIDVGEEQPQANLTWINAV
jgi:hypothetical protein